MDLREAHLPGVGRKYTLALRQGGRLVLIVHNSGQRELFWIEPDEDDPVVNIRLTEEEAREVAFILGGVRYQPLPADKVNFLLQEVVMEWIPVESHCEMDGHTLAELELRRRTGVSVIAILRGGKTIPSPDPHTERIRAGDTLVAVGTRSQIERVLPLCRKRT
ncbi:MAG: cation:proton antiporter regulatory subunit [Bacteroidia bacterium]|nr:cation:proton antiporter regulatory subunit [Bacteroidia bacterium]MCX7763745.1 cation:proton antiporter regulatory subunit [Bacteroidia bacterium]MDW8057345.1 cation:proton antiporter regulatory subunit [Bacteroidia bacterium]